MERLIAHYRGATPTDAPILRDRADVAAYAAYRMPATFEAVRSALAAFAAAVPGWAPGDHVDVGGGTGAATWAVADTWAGIRPVTVLDWAEPALALGREIAAAEPALADVRWRRARIGSGLTLDGTDLVTVSYVLNELTAADRVALVDAAASAARAVVIVEAGTPAGYERVIEARGRLVAAGFRIAAPCPHSAACPIAPGTDWCHFSARVSRSSLHRQVKGGSLAYEDEKFSYVAAVRAGVPAEPAVSRIVRRPQIRKGQVLLDLCETEPALDRVTVTKRHGDLYRAARDADWGDAWPPRPPPSRRPRPHPGPTVTSRAHGRPGPTVALPGRRRSPAPAGTPAPARALVPARAVFPARALAPLGPPLLLPLLFLPHPPGQFALVRPGVRVGAEPGAAGAAAQGLAAEVPARSADAQHVPCSASGHGGVLPLRHSRRDGSSRTKNPPRDAASCQLVSSGHVRAEARPQARPGLRPEARPQAPQPEVPPGHLRRRPRARRRGRLPQDHHRGHRRPRRRRQADDLPLVVVQGRRPAGGLPAHRGAGRRDGERQPYAFPDTGDLAADLKLVLRATVDELRDPRFEGPSRALAAEGVVNEELGRVVVAKLLEPSLQLYVERLRSAQEAGQVRRDIDPRIALELFVSPLAQRWLQRTAPFSYEYTDTLVDYALYGLAPR